MIRRMLTPIRPLSDDWLYWDPEHMEDFPDSANTDRAARPAPVGPAKQQKVRSRSPIWPGFVRTGFSANTWPRIVLLGAVLVSLLILWTPPSAFGQTEMPAAGAGPTANTEDEMSGPLVEIGQVGQGSLLFATPHAQLYRHAPVLSTDVRMDVTGPIARVSVTQTFRNTGSRWLEGVYVFPLPETAAVDHLRMQVGERVIEGIVEERGAAKRIYQKAKQSGRKAALVEQERPNIFTNTVANIGPGEEVRVTIEFQQTLRYDQGAFSIRFPMVVGPRYIPGTPAAIEEELGGFDGMGWAANTDRVPDASRITPPVMDPRQAPVNPVSLQVALQAGFPLARLESPYHAITRTEEADGRIMVELEPGNVPADRDFVLTWWPEVGHAPKAALFTETAKGESYALLMVVPPVAGRAEALAREVIFVIDTSGSMGGASIRQARRALDLAVGRLTARDRFNIIQFNSSTHRLFQRPESVTPGSLSAAGDYISRLSAGGGTRMAPALRAALETDGDGGMVRQVVFLTDGAVGNEDELFSLIEQRIGHSRLFTIGIGSAPNSHFMRRAAQFGRGGFTYIGRVEEVGEKMEALFEKLESPMLSDLKVAWPSEAGTVEAYPRRLPDLYRGEPVLVVARMDSTRGDVGITGTIGKVPWQATAGLGQGVSRPGIGVLWARRKIADLMDSRHRGAEIKDIRRQVIDVALRHHLVSKYTSLVAVDTTPTRPESADTTKSAIPTNLPHGWKYEKVFGRLPQTATPAGLHLLIGLMALGAGFLGRLRQRKKA